MSKEIIDDVVRVKAKSMGKKIYLTLPLPVSINHMYVNTRFGAKRLTSKAQRYTLDARALINQYMEEQKWECIDEKVWMYVDCVFYFSDRRIRDASNLTKLLLDVMQGYIYKNDYTALPRIHSVEYDKSNPRVEVCVSVQDKTQRERGIKITTNNSH